jgi:hypothetical protein
VCVELERIWKEVPVGYWGTFPLVSRGDGENYDKTSE